MTATFVEVGAEVFVLRYPVLDVNSTMILGDEVAVVVDTLATTGQAQELLAAIRRITDAPLTVVNTHHHFDHCFGNAVFVEADPGVSIWAHESAAEALREHPTLCHRAAFEEAAVLNEALGHDVAATVLAAPERTVHTRATVEIGGRAVQLHHLGRGHTEGDVVVWVPDAGVLIAGDLVEEGGPPSFSDSYPLEWPQTLDALRHLAAAQPPVTIVPGHGAPVDLPFVTEQQAQLSTLDWLSREGHRDGQPAEVVAAKAPFGADVAIVAIRRAYAELDGRL